MSDKKGENRKKNNVSNLLTKKAKSLKDTGKSALKTSIDTGKKIKQKVETIAEDTKKEIGSGIKTVTDGVQSEIAKIAISGAHKPKSKIRNGGSSLDKRIEDQLFSWYGWIWSIVAFAFVILISFAISSTDGRFERLPIILLVIFPIYILWVVYYSIPEIKIGNSVLFSRKSVSVRRQLSFGKALARTFSREMIKNSPQGAMVIGIFLLLLIFLILSPFV
ncbi:MAG: hypothetical protein HeimC2_26840 [Candidatus Heimdallarchaeota archaeon LC_2]|nr:MAG: hypothetical protein HeimC2_26840 [Candidatus Heimdallarchaeota archaeon LC_2]